MLALRLQWDCGRVRPLRGTCMLTSSGIDLALCCSCYFGNHDACVDAALPEQIGDSLMSGSAINIGQDQPCFVD